MTSYLQKNVYFYQTLIVLLFLVFGGYGNTRLMIRKRVQNYLIKEVTLASVVSELRPLKVLIEVSKGKEVKIVLMS